MSQAYVRQGEEDDRKKSEEEGKKIASAISTFEARDGGVTQGGSAAHVTKHAEARIGKLRDSGYDVSDHSEKKAGLKR